MPVLRMINSFKYIFWLSSLIVLLSFNASNTFADFYVVAGSRGVGIKINALPYTITSSGFYYIAKDLSCAAGSHGITITADNVTLDLMGFSLIGPGGALINNGVYLNSRINVEIRNGTIRNFPYDGIHEGSVIGTGHRIINIRAIDNQSKGIMLGSKNNLVERCTVLRNGSDGIYVYIGSIVKNNTCYGNEYGIRAAAGSIVTQNTCYNNSADGIYVYNGSSVSFNTCYDNSSNGIYAYVGSTVIGNTCYDNGTYGISLFGSSLVDQNTAYYNTTANIKSCPSCTFGTNHAP